MDLELESSEVGVGNFSADIVCVNRDDSTRVLIENQLERTDHKHLGKLLTYSAGLNTVNIVWISSQFTDEHRASLDWLNAITDEKFQNPRAQHWYNFGAGKTGTKLVALVNSKTQQIIVGFESFGKNKKAINVQ